MDTPCGYPFWISDHWEYVVWQFEVQVSPSSDRRSSAREGRPPSAFSVSTLEFEASTSRPTSGSTPTSAPALEPLADLHRPVIHTEGHRVLSPHVPRPPSGDPQGRPRPPSTTSSGEPLSPLLPIPTPLGQKFLIKHKLERQRSRSINELAHPLPSCHAHHDTENESSQRRVQSGPKERTTPEPDDESDKLVAKAGRFWSTKTKILQGWCCLLSVGCRLQF